MVWLPEALHHLEHKDAMVHRIRVDDIHKDLFSPRDKPLYGKYKNGILETGSTFDADIRKEQEMVEKGVAKMSDFEHVKDYTSLVNHKLQSKFQFQSARVVERSFSRSLIQRRPSCGGSCSALWH